MRSFERYKGVCWVCHETIVSIDETTFHHLRRGIENLHCPENMVPLHKKKGCHEILHNSPAGSFTVAAQERTARGSVHSNQKRDAIRRMAQEALEEDDRGETIPLSEML